MACQKRLKEINRFLLKFWRWTLTGVSLRAAARRGNAILDLRADENDARVSDPGNL
jgi:hypothetical protein